jgi:hypothetical protein
MPEVKNREFRYEVMVSVNGRWEIKNIYDDERESLIRARAMVHSETKAEAIRVNQNRRSPNGFTIEKEILMLDRLDAYRRQEFMPGKIDAVAVCQDFDDVFRLDSRRALERLLRPYLGVQSLTPTEFLHIGQYHRELERASGGLLLSALGTISRLQSQAMGIKHRERMDQLQKMADHIQRRASNFMVEVRKLPRLDKHSFQELEKKIKEQVAPEDFQFTITALVCHDLMEYRATFDKMERLIVILGQSSAAGIVILDRLFADMVMAPGVMKDLLGPQISLSDHLKRCVDVMRGDYMDRVEDPSKLLVVLSQLMTTGLMPESREAFESHVVRAISNDTPLDRRDANPDAERDRLNDFIRYLQMPDGTMMRDDLWAVPLAGRRRKIRAALLRGSGLEEIAAALS